MDATSKATDRTLGGDHRYHVADRETDANSSPAEISDARFGSGDSDVEADFRYESRNQAKVTRTPPMRFAATTSMNPLPDSSNRGIGKSFWRFFRATRRLIYAIVLVLSVALTSCSQPTESASMGTSIQGSAEPVIVGESSLEERVYYADVIVRGKLKSTSTSTEPGYRSTEADKRYQGLVHFVFDVHEYIRGSGGPELSVVATVNLRSDVIREIIEFSAKGEFVDLHEGDWLNPYTTEALALEAAKEWEQARDRRWDDRESLILAHEVDATSDDSKRYSLGQIFSYSIGGKNAVWLPLAEDPDALDANAQDGNRNRDEARYLLKVPESSSATDESGSADGVLETITIPELKAVMARLEQWRKDGEGVEGHEYCIHSSFIDKRRVNEAKERGETTYVRSDRSMESGTPAGTALIATHTLDGNVWLEGTGAEVFEVAPYSNGVIRTQRPLHGGVFRYFWNRQGSTYIPCGYLPDDAQNTIEHFVTVTVPEGVIHEAFFDPVAIGDAVGADATIGQLKPVEFDVEGGGTKSISSIEWEDGEVRMVLSPSAPSDGYDLDFIGLDGDVSLRLLGSEATVSGGTITWEVATQPWNDGDLLMLRMWPAAHRTPTIVPSVAPTRVLLDPTSVTEEHLAHEPSPSPTREAGEVEYQVQGHQIIESAPTTLEEVIHHADLIARVQLVSAQAAVGSMYGKPYPRFEFRFEVLEYLKGDGEEGIVVYTHVPRSIYQVGDYTAEQALQVAQEEFAARDSRWDDREAIVLLRTGLETDLGTQIGFAGRLLWNDIHRYAISSGLNRAWLPIADESADSRSGVGAIVERRYLTKVSSEEESDDAAHSVGTTEVSIPLSEVLQKIQENEELLKAGTNIPGYTECVAAMLNFEAEFLTDPNWWETYTVEHSIPSGRRSGYKLASSTSIVEKSDYYGKWWTDGPNSDLFVSKITDDPDNDPKTGYAWIDVTTRPIPMGTYNVARKNQPPEWVPCDYNPDRDRDSPTSYLEITVTAPEGVVHEAFFDPVAIGDAVGADATNGQLKPVEFDVEGGGTRSISSIEWEDGEVTMVLSPSAPSDGYDLDFIGLDGNVTLRLLGAEATVSAGTITWDVAMQPWNDGDLLMLRMWPASPPVPTPTPDPSVVPTPIQ